MDDASADAAIVLGAAVWNGQPSPVFAERINHAITLYHEGRVRFLIFTGGAGTNEAAAESLVAASYAIENGVAAKDTFCETSSKITFENLQGAKQITRQLGLGRVLIVSDPLHMRRSIEMARDLGLDAYPSPTQTTRYISFLSRSVFLLREIFFYGIYLVERPFIIRFGIPKEMVIQPCN